MYPVMAGQIIAVSHRTNVQPYLQCVRSFFFFVSSNIVLAGQFDSPTVFSYNWPCDGKKICLSSLKGLVYNM